MSRCLLPCSQGQAASSLSFSPKVVRQLSALGLLTIKPVLYVCNIGAHYDEAHVGAVREHASLSGSGVVAISALTERELSDLSVKEAASMRTELSLDGGSVDSIIETAYMMLGYISFFTTGEKETRAWTISKESSAPRAARAIHTDFEKNFIRAEVISCEDLLVAGSYAAARSAGLLRLEGKEYVVLDGDVIVFRIG